MQVTVKELLKNTIINNHEEETVWNSDLDKINEEGIIWFL